MIRNDASVARCFLELQSKIVPSSAGLAGLLTNVATRRPPPHRSIVATVQAARVAQWIRRRSPKPKIGGSSPPVGNIVFGQNLSVACGASLFNTYSSSRQEN